jgi:uncharacterized protein (TIGR02145 family)
MKFHITKQFKTILISIITIALITVGILLWYNTDVVEATWWNDNWSYRKAIVINHNYVEADLVNFPVLISLTNANLGTHAQEDGDDIIFISQIGRRLAHEIEKYASSTGELVAWVKIPSLSSADDTLIYMYYGNAGVGNQQDAANVWDEDYVGVWHLPDDETASGTDSTLYNNDGDVKNGASTTATAQIDGAMQFDGSDDYVDVGDVYNGVRTVSFWIKAASTTEKIIDLDGGTHTILLDSGTASTTGFTSPTIYVDGVESSTVDTNWRFVVITTNTGIDASAVDIGKVASAAWTCGTDTVTDYDENTYNTVLIGDQCWMKENLNTTHDANGTAITRYCYDDAVGCGDDYGGLYLWDTTVSCTGDCEANQGICPTGWHVPTDAELYTLEYDLWDGETGACADDRTTWDCEPAGTALKPGGSSNFEGLPAGYRHYSTGSFVNRGSNARFWSSTEYSSTHAWGRRLYLSYVTTLRSYYDKDYGYSVRCLGGGDSYYDGILDEVRVSNAVRSAAWIKTSFTNQASTTLFLSPQAEEIGPGPVGYWSFDKGYGTTAYDESGQGNDGAITGATWQDESMCVSGKCLWFDGTDDYVQVGDSNTLDITDNYTVSAWIKPNGWGEGNQYGRIFQKGNSTSSRYVLFIDKSSSETIIFCKNDTDYDATNGSISLNQWQHVAATYDGTTLKLYIDGIQNVNTYSGANLSVNGDSLYIGNRNTQDRTFDGFIDEVKIYPYARTAEEIRQDYNAGLAGAKTAHGVSAAFGGASDKWLTDGLVGYWKMDESATTSGAFDTSGNGNIGTYIDSASTTAGKFGNGGVFDGDGDYISISSPNIGQPGDYTISAWVKTANSTCCTSGIYAIFCVNSYDPDFAMYNQQPLVYDNGYIYSSGSGTISDGEWHHVVFSRSGGTVSFYIDGESDGTGNHSATFPVVSQLRIGFNNHNEDYWNGNIDEVRIYNRALAPDEVRKLYEWAPGPVAHWRFDEKTGTTAYDSAASTTFSGGNHGTLGGGTPSYRPAWTRGKYGSALEFDGVDDYINTPHVSELEITEAITLMAWVKPFNSDAQDRVIQKRSGPNRCDYALICKDTSGGCYVQFRAYGDAGDDFGTVTSKINLNEWSHIATTFIDSANTVKIYVNGVETESSNSFTSDIPTSGEDLQIGGHTGTSRWFDGPIDDVRIYSYVRTQKQIIQDMNAGHPAGGSPIGSEVLYLKFDKGYGPTAYDSSPQGNNGTLVASTSGSNTSASEMWSLDGKFGRAMEFDGVDDYVEVDDSDNLDGFTVGATWSFWVKITGNLPNSAGERQTFLMKYDTGGGGQRAWFFEVHYEAEFNNIAVPCFFSSPDGDCYNAYWANYSLQTDTWYHFVYEWISDDYPKLWINGIEITDGDRTSTSNCADPTPPNIFNSTSPLHIGKSTYEVNRELDGLIDEVRIYPFTLNEDEIKLIYNQGKAAVMGSLSTATTTLSTGSGQAVHIPSWSASQAYCVPGSNDYCVPPVLELKMDEKQGTTTYDTSGQGNDGVFVSSPSWTRGKFGAGLEFSGSNKVTISETDTLDTANFTVESWIKANSLSGDQGIIDNKCPGNPGACDSGQDGFALYLDGSYPYIVLGHSSGYSTCPFSNTISIGIWNHLAATYNGSTVKRYLNGIFAGESDDSLFVYSANDIGTDLGYVYAGGGITGYFDGVIDQVKIYDYARTPAQIAWGYNKGKPVAHWKFDECSGGTIYDESGKGNHGTLQLGTSGVTATGTCASSSNSFWYNGRNGHINSGGSFDGTDDWVEVGDTGLDINTVSFWIKPDSDSERIIINLKGETLVFIENGIVKTSGFTDPTIYVDGVNSSKVDTNWHQVLITTNTAIDANDMKIGKVVWGEVFYYDGLIDEVKIWNYALTAEQIKMEYSGGAVRFGQ